MRPKNLSSSLQKIEAMEVTLSKAEKSYPDCSSMASKLRAMAYSTEEQLRAHQKQASYFIHLAGRTFPKGLHCLSLRLTTEYFTMQPEEHELFNRHNEQKPNLYHYAIFSDNILACAVVVNSTISKSKVRTSSSVCCTYFRQAADCMYMHLFY